MGNMLLVRQRAVRANITTEWVNFQWKSIEFGWVLGFEALGWTGTRKLQRVQGWGESWGGAVS